MTTRAALLAALVVLMAHGQSPDLPDPLPLRRVVLSADRIAAELKRYPDGTLLRRPRAEFEKLVQAAAKAVRGKASPPRLLEARYRAKLNGDGALVGTAEWKVANPGGVPALLPLGGFNLAVRSSRYENREALLVDLATGPALFVDEAGDQTVTLEWSTRVDARPEGAQLELQLPDCPAAVLELDLPAGRALVARPEDVPVVGPSRAEAADRRTWTVACGARTALSLTIRHARDDRPLVLLATQRATQKLSPDGLDAAHTFNLTALHKDVEELTLRLDRRLRPVEVSAPDLERWEPLPGGRLRVKLARPVREVTVQVRALAPLGGPAWESPGMSVEGALPRGETLELWLHPGLEVASWKPGDFRLVASAARPDEPFRVLTLQGGGVASGKAGPRRPTLEPRAGGATFHTTQQLLWRLEADSTDLTCVVNYTVVRGELFHLPLALPAGWAAETVDLSPPDLLRGWTMRQQRGVTVLHIDLRRPAGPETSLGVVVRLRRTEAVLPTGRDLPFPDVVPLGGRYRDTGLAIDYDQQTHAVTARCVVEPTDAPPEGPWGRKTPDLYYPFRGDAVSGTLRLTTRAPQARSRCAVTVQPAGGAVTADCRLTVEAEGGRPGEVDLFIPGPAGSPWRWRVESGEARVSRFDRLPALEAKAALAALAARSPLELLAFRAATPRGTRWRLVFDRPLVPGRPVVLRATRTLEPAAGRWTVPLPAVLGRFEGEVLVPNGGVEVAQSAGLSEGPTPRAGRAFRYGPLPGRLTLQPRGARPAAPAEGLLDGVALTTRLTADGSLHHDFAFTVRRWTQRTFPVQLPPGARLLSARLDGRWLDPSGDGPFELPFPAHGTGSYRLTYATAGPGGLWPRLDAPAPLLPVPPRGVRRLWLLPQGVRPLFDGVVRGLPGSGGQAESPLRYPTDLLRLGPLSPPRSATPGERQQALDDAVAALPRRPGMTLGQVVRELATGFLRDAHPLIVDAAALAEFGLGPETTLPESPGAPWDAIGLEMAARRGGVLLTVPGRPRDEAAVEQAAGHGRDSSGRYVAAIEWLQGGARPAEAIPEGWSGWEPVAGNWSSSSLTVVRSSSMSALGVGLAALVVVLMLAKRGRPAAVRVRWLIGLLTISGVALAWLPASLLDLARWPLLAGLLLGIPLATLAGTNPRRAPSTARHNVPISTTSATLTGLLLLALLATTGSARPAEEVVFLIDGPTPSVLAPPSLLERLETMARSNGLPRQEAVLTQARYEGRLSGAVAEFDATFHLHSFTDEKSTLTLPLDGVSLVGDVRLDGARVLPRALAAPRVGYAVGVSGKGGHKLELRFRVPVTALGDEAAGVRQVRCGVPRLVRSRVLFKGPAGAAHLYAPSKLGGLTVKVEGGVPSLDADLGPAANLVLRWFQEPKQPRPRQTFREAYVWELQPENCTLKAFLRYTLSEGAAEGLSVTIPAELEVQSAVASRPRHSTDAPVRLRDWFMHTPPGTRQLQLEFPGPVTGEVEVELQLVPRGPLSGPALLTLPRPSGEVAEGAVAHLGYRLTGLDARRATQGLTGIVVDRYASDWPVSTRRPWFEKLTAAFTFRRQAGTTPELRMDLWPRAEPFDVVQDVRITVGRRRADLSARVEVTPSGPLAALEWDVGPGVTLTDVRGPGVSRWTQTGTQLLVWLERPAEPGTLHLTGWAAVAGPGKQPARFDLPCLRPLGGSARSTLKLEALPGVTLAERSVTLLKPGGGFTYIATGPFYGGTFDVRPEPPPPVWVVTRGRLDGPAVAFDSRVEYRAAVPSEVGARLRDWPGEAQLEVDPARVASSRELHRRGPDSRERVWRLATKPGKGLAFDVRARVPAGGSPVPVPDVRPLTPATERLVVIEPSLVVESSRGLVPVAVPAGSAAGSLAWRVTAEDWTMRVVPRRAAAGAAALLTEVTASVPDGRTWLHEVTWWLRLEGPAELTAVMPGMGAAIVGVSVDGEPAGQMAGGRAVVALAGPGLRRLRVRYRRDPGYETLSRPDLTPPRLEGAAAGPVVWTVAAPAGWSLAASSASPLPAAVGWAVRDLYRAEAIRSGPEAARLLRSAELALEAHPESAARGPDGLTLPAWLARLREEVGPQPESVPAVADEVEGCPSRWLTDGDAPVLRLTSDAGRWPEQALGATAQWLGVWLAVWLVSLSPALRTAGRWLWPEVVALVGAAGWWLTGPTVAVGLLIAGGVASRVVIMWRAVARWLTPRR